MVSLNLRGGRLAALGLFGAATLASAAASAQTELKTYADDKGYINVRALTCGQLAGTFQEDADFMGTWYSGWWNGHNKRHSFNLARVRDGIHEVIVYCKAHPDEKVVDAVDEYVKRVSAGAK